MKGPGNRGRHDVRRLWECAACQRRVKTPGTVVYLLCTCGPKETPPRERWMLLVEQTGPKIATSKTDENTA
jgi:hypothetical protein